MKTTISKLKQLINEHLLVEVPVGSGMRKPQFGLSSGGGGLRPAKFDPAVHDLKDVMWAVMDEFAGVASDLGVDDIKDPAFIGYIGDQLTDKGVPNDIILQVKAKLQRGQSR